MVIFMSNTNKSHLLILLAFCLLLVACADTRDSVRNQASTMPASSVTAFSTASLNERASKETSTAAIGSNIQIKNYSILTKESIHKLISGMMNIEQGTGRIELISASGRRLYEQDLFSATAQKQFFIHKGNLIELSDCYLAPERLSRYYRGKVVHVRLMFNFLQASMPEEIKEFMCKHFAYQDSLPNSLAYLKFNELAVSERYKRGIAFIPKAYIIKYKGKEYYVLQSVRLAYPNLLLKDKHLLKLNVSNVEEITDSYCDGVYVRFGAMEAQLPK